MQSTGDALRKLIEARKAANAILWACPRWIKAVAAWVPGRVCAWCKRPAELPHHPDDQYYGTKDYLDFDKCKCIPMCRSCHDGGHKGKELCPRCRQGVTIPGLDYCSQCMTDEEKAHAAWKREHANRVRNRLSREAYQRAKAKRGTA